MSTMKLGVNLPLAGAGASPEAILRVAEEAERAGLDSVWAWDRLMRPTEPIAMGGPGGPVMDAPEQFAVVYDALETLAFVAARTRRITLGTSVLDALFSSPVVLARQLATLDRLCDGRLVVGVGQGWMEQEFVAAGVPMSRRGAGFEEHLRAMRAVWGPDPVEFGGRFYEIPSAEIGPKPIRPGGPTLLIGSAASPAVERAARLGAGLTLVIFDWESVGGTIATFREAEAAAGHEPGSLPVLLQVNGVLTEHALDQRAPLLGSVDQVATDLERAASLGVGHVYWNSLVEDPLEQIPLIAQLRG
jgi:probable F420-dependent oxidoreductase